MPSMLPKASILLILPREQAAVFLRGKLIANEFVLLFNVGDIEDLFETEKESVVILALTAAYDFLAYGFTCKLLNSSR